MVTQLTITSPLGSDGAPVYLAAQTTSTMDDARRLVAHGSPSGTVIVTDHQTAGRGRRAGRVWHSGPRESLMFTLALDRPAEPVTRSLAMAAAVVRLLDEEGELAARVKWPNDVLVDDRKICGILADHDGRWLYLGVGLNVRQERFPEELGGAATSLRIAVGGVRRPHGAPAGSPTKRVPADASWSHNRWPELRDRLLARLLALYADSQRTWHALLTERLWRRGEAVEVVAPDGRRIAGTITGIETDGRLIVTGEAVHRVAAGEVSLYRRERHG